MTLLSSSNALFRPCILLLSRALAATRRCLWGPKWPTLPPSVAFSKSFWMTPSADVHPGSSLAMEMPVSADPCVQNAWREFEEIQVLEFMRARLRCWLKSCWYSVQLESSALAAIAAAVWPVVAHGGERSRTSVADDWNVSGCVWTTTAFYTRPLLSHLDVTPSSSCRSDSPRTHEPPWPCQRTIRQDPLPPSPHCLL